MGWGLQNLTVFGRRQSPWCPFLPAGLRDPSAQGSGELSVTPSDFPRAFGAKAPAIANHLAEAIRFRTVSLQTQQQKKEAKAAAAAGTATSGGLCAG
jgi:hypothetical protein